MSPVSSLDIVTILLYFNLVMAVNQQVNKVKFFCRATGRQRLCAAVVLAAVVAVFVFLWLASVGVIDVGLLVGPCGFKQRYHLPCPACGVTTAAVAFVRGRIFEAFYIQPAAGVLCSILAVGGFLALLTAVFGVYYEVLNKALVKVKTRWVVLAVLIIVAAGWAVTLARALAANG